MIDIDILIKEVQDIILELDPQDAEGRLWWTRFKGFLEMFKNTKPK